MSKNQSRPRDQLGRFISMSARGEDAEMLDVELQNVSAHEQPDGNDADVILNAENFDPLPGNDHVDNGNNDPPATLGIAYVRYKGLCVSITITIIFTIIVLSK